MDYATWTDALADKTTYLSFRYLCKQRGKSLLGSATRNQGDCEEQRDVVPMKSEPTFPGLG